MKILITGAKGFIGKNLVAELHNRNYQDIYEAGRSTTPELLDHYCRDCDFVFHLAGVNRPNNPEEFMEGNYDFLFALLKLLKKNHNTCPILLSSSIQVMRDNPYGKSKKAAEDLLFSYSKETGAEVFVYQFPNIFGKWCRPDYNSVIATFCYNIAHNLPIQIRDRNIAVKLVCIDDVIVEMIRALEGNANKEKDGYCYVEEVYTATLGEIADLIYAFRESREKRDIPDMTGDSFSKKLYNTYLTYLPKDKFLYPLKMNIDERGSFTEIFRTTDRGQFSVNISKPGIVKGNHWHQMKNEKFLVLKGNALIQLRRINEDEVIEYHVSGDKMEVVDIPAGYAHAIINEGSKEMVTFMWCSECFDPEKPDTYFLKVVEENEKA